MSALKLFQFTAANMQTKETISFLGQGMSIAEAFSDGVKNCGETYRPSQSGGATKAGEKGGPNRVGCRQPDGSIVWRSLREFESSEVVEAVEL